MRLEGKVCAYVGVVLGVPQDSVLEPLLFILYIFKFLHIVGNYIVGFADDTTIYSVIPRSLSRPQLLKSLNHDLAVIDSWCLKWHIRLNPKKKICGD